MPPILSVIIVSWNVRDDLVRCIDALCSEQVKGDLSLEIIVVDNASSDGTQDALSSYPIVLLTNPKNVGYGRANNMGFQLSHGRHLLVLNPDTIPQPGSLVALVDFLESHPLAGIVSPRLLNPDGSVQAAAFAFPTVAMALLDLFPLPALVPGRIRRKLQSSRLNGRYPDEQIAQHPFRIDHPLGACLLIRREAHEQCGGFDERIFMYSEEIDLAIRYAQAGWESWQVPSARVVHLGGQSTGQMPDRMFVELWRSRLYVSRRYYNRRQQIMLRLIVRVAMIRDIVLDRLRRIWGGKHGGDAGRTRRARAVLRMLAEE